MTSLGRMREGLLLGALAVTAFSLSLPATRAAVPELGPTMVGLGRAVVAAALAGVLLAVRRERLPERRYWPRLALVAGGVVVGFPLNGASLHLGRRGGHTCRSRGHAVGQAHVPVQGAVDGKTSVEEPVHLLEHRRADEPTVGSQHIAQHGQQHAYGRQCRMKGRCHHGG